MRFDTDRLLFFDIETNGLTPDIVWCIVIRQNGRSDRYYGSSIPEAIKRLSDPSATLVPHNGIDFDLPVLNKLYGLEYNVDNVYDTCIMSRLLRPDRGGHSLEDWGQRVRVRKLPDLDWNHWDEGMLERCETDVLITELTYRQLRREQTGHDWSLAAWIEHWIAHYHQRQAANGVRFDVEAATRLADEIQERADNTINALRSKMPWQVKHSDKPTSPYNKDGSRPQRLLNYWGSDVSDVCGPYCKTEFSEPNPNSDKQLKAFLKSCGWVPDEFNYVKDPLTGKPKRPLEISGPKLSDSSLEQMGEIGQLVMSIGVLEHRLSLLRNRNDNEKGLVNKVRNDGRVVAGGIPMGTPTGRYTHFGVVNIPKAHDETKMYGTELRGLFCAEDGWEFAGSDADGLEARMEGHYTFPFDNGAYANTLIHGNKEKGDDVHTRNAALWMVSRQIAKNGKYCLSYGGQAPKLANTLGIDPKLGQKYFDMFWDGNDSLKRLKNVVTNALKRGWLKGIDGRKLYSRSPHSALNLLFQSAGSIVVKLATIYVNQELDKAGFVWRQVIHMHDEFLLEFKEGQDHVAIETIISDCWKRAGETLKLNVPITGETQWGHTWAECH